jgi:hypothetical protein
VVGWHRAVTAAHPRRAGILRNWRDGQQTAFLRRKWPSSANALFENYLVNYGISASRRFRTRPLFQGTAASPPTAEFPDQIGSTRIREGGSTLATVNFDPHQKFSVVFLRQMSLWPSDD